MPASLPTRILALMLAILCAALPLACSEEGTLAPGAKEVSRADKYLEQGNFAAAMTAYEAAIAADSANSRAYYGYVKATLGFYRVDSASLLNDFLAQFSAPPGEFGDAFFEHPDSVLTARLQALVRVDRTMDRFFDRDSLGLMDGAVSARSLLPEAAVYKLTYNILGLYDFPPKGTWDETDRKMRNLPLPGGGFADLEGLADSMKVDSAIAQELNQKILDLRNGKDGLDSLLSLLPADPT